MQVVWCAQCPNRHDRYIRPSRDPYPRNRIDLERGVIRGVESNGMLVSERELKISDDHEGIIDLDDKFEIGTPAAAALGLTIL